MLLVRGHLILKSLISQLIKLINTKLTVKNLYSRSDEQQTSDLDYLGMLFYLLVTQTYTQKSLLLEILTMPIPAQIHQINKLIKSKLTVKNLSFRSDEQQTSDVD